MIGQNILLARNKLKMKQQELAAKMNVTAGAVSQWEHDRTMPDATTLPRLAEALETTVSALMGESPQAPTPPADEAHQLYESLSDQDKEKALEYMRFILSQRKKG